MTYGQFLLLFLLPPLALLAVLTRNRTGPVAGALQPRDRRSWLFYVLLPLLALLYTTPWDNYLVYKGVWSYPPDRVLGRIGYVPFEEYAFIVLQSLLGGLWMFWLLRRMGADPSKTGGARWWAAGMFVALALCGVPLLFTDRGLYLGLILVWAMPVLAFQWAFGGDLLSGLARVRLTAVSTLTGYLWLADRLALGLDIWQISPRYTLGVSLLGLPAEEALFFLVTNVIVVEGLLLFIHPLALPRLHALLARLQPSHS